MDNKFSKFAWAMKKNKFWNFWDKDKFHNNNFWDKPRFEKEPTDLWNSDLNPIEKEWWDMEEKKWFEKEPEIKEESPKEEKYEEETIEEIIELYDQLTPLIEKLRNIKK